MVAQIEATSRPRAGKGAARASRRDGRVPAVIYGNKKEPALIDIDANELSKLISRGRFYASVFEVAIDGKVERVLPRDVQLHPVKDVPIHVDFQRVNEDGRVRVSVPVEFLNRDKSPGLKRGGALNVVRHEVEVYCPADSIPAAFEIDLGEVNIGTSIHISSVQLPQGVTPTITSRDFTIATIVGKGGKAEEPGA
ncbi:MAG: 50S ribosomal protein L25/general stress protein Ctc [Hyphomicrobiaceae bacterium]